MDPSFLDAVIVRVEGPEGLLRANRAFCDQLGWTEDELAAKPLLDWIHPDDRPRLAELLEAAAGTTTARHSTSEQTWRVLEWKVRGHGEGVGVYGRLCEAGCGEASGQVTPATPRRASLADTLNTMALIVEARNPGMRCSILLVDSQGEYITGGAGPSLPAAYNQAVEGLRIGPAVGSCGTAAFWNRPVVVEDIYRDPLWRDLHGAAALAGVSACWSQPVTSTAGHVLGAMALYANEPQAPTKHQMDGLEIAARMVGMAIERDRLEEQLRRTMKMEAVGVLAGGIAHDFNNLMAVVLGNAELAKGSLDDPAAVAPLLQEIETASLNASGLCDQLLAYAGRGARAAELVDFNGLVQELGGLMNVALSKKATLALELDPQPVGVRGDASQLRQVVMNLITNAAEAVGDAEGHVLVRTGVEELAADRIEGCCADSDLAPGECLRLQVEDTGVGMGPRTLARMFDPFFTTKSGGRGLGLAAAQGIIHAHGGAIEVDSTPGKGTLVTVWLPRVTMPASTGDPQASPRASVTGHVLLVDDEPPVRKVLGDILERAGYSVTRAEDGAQALEVFERDQDRIDCVLLDLSMPKMSGEEVFAAIRQVRDDVPVVLSSGFTEQEIVDRFRGAGLAGVLQKPTRKEDLLEKIAAATQQP